MARLRFHAPPHHTLKMGALVVHGGEEFELPDEQALELVTDPHTDVRELDEELEDLVTDEAPHTGSQQGGIIRPPEQDRVALTRSELDELARQAGVEDPERLPNKAAVEAAIDESEAEGQEEPSGEGHDKTDEGWRSSL